MKNNTLLTLVSLLLFLSFYNCSSDSSDDVNDETIDDALDEGTEDTFVVNVDPAFFTAENVTITTVPCTLSDGTETDCYQIITSSAPSDHQMGPWCPENISDDATAGGIWLEGGEIYDVDGAFVENMAAFYNDANWQMYDANGAIYITETEEDCINAANPNVGDEYENFCVECLPSYVADLTQTWLIPITPVAQTTATLFSTAGGGPPGGPGTNAPSTRGVALNGIEFSAPAPTDNILGAYTLAPFDDAGGHINVNQGYHYHAATAGITDRHVIAQEDGHSALIGYALDGYGIYELEDVEGNVPSELDELRGHTDDIRGYHYHVDQAGSNNFINGLKGAYAN